MDVRLYHNPHSNDISRDCGNPRHSKNLQCVSFRKNALSYYRKKVDQPCRLLQPNEREGKGGRLDLFHRVPPASLREY